MIDAISEPRSSRRRQSLELGVNGHEGLEIIPARRRYPGSYAKSHGDPLDDEEYAAHASWGRSLLNLALGRGLIKMKDRSEWGASNATFTYKQVWYASLFPRSGLYHFPYGPYLFELIRRIRSHRLDYEHLYAPSWLVIAISHMICYRPQCPDRFPPLPGYDRADSLTFAD